MNGYPFLQALCLVVLGMVAMAALVVLAVLA
jgi:hypothetical protein